MTSSNSVFEVVFDMFCRDKISTIDKQFKDFIDPMIVLCGSSYSNEIDV